jgi:hypothetical protein
VFIGSTGTVVISNSLAGMIYDFGAGDVIDLTGVPFATLGPVVVNDGTATIGSATLDFAGALPGSASFTTVPDATGGTLLTDTDTRPDIWSTAGAEDWSRAAANSTRHA